MWGPGGAEAELMPPQTRPQNALRASGLRLPGRSGFAEGELQGHYVLPLYLSSHHGAIETRVHDILLAQ